MISQHHILNELANLLDNGTIQSTLKTTLNGLTVSNFKKAHQLLESGTTIGKIAIKF
jgi:NADPH2:quinone reductase